MLEKRVGNLVSCNMFCYSFLVWEKCCRQVSLGRLEPSTAQRANFPITLHFQRYFLKIFPGGVTCCRQNCINFLRDTVCDEAFPSLKINCSCPLGGIICKNKTILVILHICLIFTFKMTTSMVCTSLKKIIRKTESYTHKLFLWES